MYTDLFVGAEMDYRRQRLLREAQEHRLARSVPRRTPWWASWFNGVKEVPATSRPAARAS